MAVLRIGLALVVIISGLVQNSCADEWAYWRGPEFNGISRDTGLVDNWNPRGGPGSNVLWDKPDLGGISTPIVMHGRLYVLARSEPGTAREGERVVCADADTGETIWEHRFNVYLSDVPDTRVGWSSVVGDPETGNVYALGACGLFFCLDGETGRVQWSVPMHERFGLLSTYGGRTNFPIVFEDLVITSAVMIGWGETARPCHRFLAFDKRTGDVVWFTGTRDLPEDTTYSAPTIAVVGGQQLLIVGAGDGGIWAFQPRTGKPVWFFNLSRRGINAPPLVVGDRVYAVHSEENIEGTEMGAVVAFNAVGSDDITNTNRIWAVEGLMVGRSAPLLIDDRLYLFDDRAKLHILDSETGESVAKRVPLGTFMRGSPLYADGKIFAVTVTGRWYIMKPDARRGATILSRGQLLPGDECHASPICVNGKVYVRTNEHLYCLADPDTTPVVQPPLPLPEEATLTDRQPAWLQLVPAEMLLRPGDRQQLQARLFNRLGQSLGDVDASFEVEGPGVVDGDQLTIPEGDRHRDAYVLASTSGLQARSRIRIVPPLPWSFDFAAVRLAPATGLGEPPVTWIGCRYRHVIREVEGRPVMVKVTTIPKGTRSQGWFGQSDLANYTIQADVRADERNGSLPDIGLIAQGYVLDLQGKNQKLQIRSWASQLHNARDVDFAWQPHQWYTMKLRSEVVDDQAVLRGKVWPANESEPDAWNVEAEDPAPNFSGSPGLFGNATDAEIFLDNIRVYEND